LNLPGFKDNASILDHNKGPESSGFGNKPFSSWGLKNGRFVCQTSIRAKLNPFLYK